MKRRLFSTRLFRLACLAFVASIVGLGAGPSTPAPIPTQYAQHPLAAVSGEQSHAAHYIILKMQPDGSIRPLQHSQVRLAAALRTSSDRELAQQLQEPERNAQGLIVALESPQGEMLYQSLMRVPRWVRGEFQDPLKPEGPIEGHWLPAVGQVFVVRVPVIPKAQLSLRDRQDKLLARFDLEHLAANTPQIEPASPGQYAPSQLNGSPANRADLLIMGDGYTLAQQDKFTIDATRVLSGFFSISPLSQYRNYFNTYLLFSPSNQSGADHPPYQAGCSSPSCCGDPLMLSDPLQGTFVDTAFDVRFCSSNIYRLLGVNYEKVYAAAAAVPDWDAIAVVVNDPTYGGLGGGVTVFTMHEDCVSLMQHEFGHAFGNLADEYEDPYPGHWPCSDINGSPCEANVTDVTARERIKWSPWISPTTPIPTVPLWDPAFADVVGLFEGARYQAIGIYRPGQNCLMRTLGKPFCQVPSQAMVLRLYEGGWGTPWLGISLLEPGSLWPVTDTLDLPYPYGQVFRVEILQPISESPVSISWSVNGTAVPDALSATYIYTPTLADLGKAIQVQVSVSDTTSLVHPVMAGKALEDSYTWTIRVTRLSYLPIVLKR